MRVTVDIEPRSYRETIKETLRHLRPGHEFTRTDPSGAPSDGPVQIPGLVISDRPDPGGTFAWAEVRFEAHAVTRLRVGAERREIRGLDLAGLLSILDTVEQAAGATDEPGRVERAV